MSGFDAAAPGTPAHAWALGDTASAALPYPGDQVVVLAAHPDDETLGAGGLIGACTRLGVAVNVVVATDGEASHPGSTTHTSQELAVIRRREVQAAVDTLAPGVTVRFLGLPDGDLARHAAALTAQLAHLAQLATHLVSPWTGDRHPDHLACGAAATEVATRHGARHWQYPIWAWHWADPAGDDLPRELLRRVALTPGDVEAKQRALRCYVSQHSPLSERPGDEAVLSPRLLEHFARADEYFVVAGHEDASVPGYFDDLYTRSPDPWRLETRRYEKRKRAITLAALPWDRFRRAFEPGSATGLLTEQLAARCDEVVAWDVADRAVEQTRARVVGASAVSVSPGRIPDEWPAGQFDLILLSEVGYYCRDLDLLVERVLDSVSLDGCVLACHWRRSAPDHPHSGHAVHAALDRKLHTLTTVVDEDFLLHVWTRSTTHSVAAAEGIVG